MVSFGKDKLLQWAHKELEYTWEFQEDEYAFNPDSGVEEFTDAYHRRYNRRLERLLVNGHLSGSDSSDDEVGKRLMPMPKVEWYYQPLPRS